MAKTQTNIHIFLDIKVDKIYYYYYNFIIIINKSQPLS